MTDMLVRLYALKKSALSDKSIDMRRTLACEKHFVSSWVKKNFSRGWADECEISFSREPSACFVAVKDGKILGFACYDAAAKGFFGPIGIKKEFQKLKLGQALALRTLAAMREAGYAYAIIGWAGPIEFFKKIAGAVEIENSEPGIYKNLLKGNK